MNELLNPFDINTKYQIDLKTGKLVTISESEEEKSIENNNTNSTFSYTVYFHESLSTTMLHELVKIGFTHSEDSKIVLALPETMLTLISDSIFHTIFILFHENFDEISLSHNNKSLILSSFTNIKQTYERNNHDK